VRYYLPTIRSDKEGFTQLAKLKDVLSHSFDDELIIDFSSCTFFDANIFSQPLSKNQFLIE